jgi:hypothetical protein
VQEKSKDAVCSRSEFLNDDLNFSSVQKSVVLSVQIRKGCRNIRICTPGISIRNSNITHHRNSPTVICGCL